MKMWKCDKCGKVFQRQVHLADHRRTHSKVRPYKCQSDKCIQSFRGLSQLQRHKRHHLDIRKHQCKICKVCFLSSSNLQLHHCTPHHRRQHRCHLCSATFPRILSLAYHINNEHHRKNLKQHLRCKITNRLGNKLKQERLNEEKKILLKITVGKSMTIISPSREKRRKDEKKKSKKKHKKERRMAKKGIILSIKDGKVNVTDERINNKIDQQKQMQKNGLSKSEYQLSEQKSELKLTIKACPELSTESKKIETYKVLDRSDSNLSLKFERKSSSYSDIDKLVKGRETGGQKDSSSDLKMLITKDKSGNFLAGNLLSVKAKKKDRENVFDSLSDVGLWKVMPSPRTDGLNDPLKLKLSPQKPARLESTLDLACAHNASNYLGIPVHNTFKTKGDNSGEDSDVLEILPLFDKELDDKESDGGMNNVNDSGIEVLSSSSCNRSNGNSVRSVVMEESPTYFHTEDSLLSLDSPFMDGMNKSEHSICHRCGRIIMETNNNTRSPGKCRCSSMSNPNSPFQTPVSPVKMNLHSPESVKATDSAVNEVLKKSSPEYQKEANSGVKNLETLSEVNENSGEEDSDIMIISFNKNDSLGSRTPEKEGRSRLKLKLRPKDSSKSSPNTSKELKPSEKEATPESLSPKKNLRLSSTGCTEGSLASKSDQSETIKCPEFKSSINNNPSSFKTKSEVKVNLGKKLESASADSSERELTRIPVKPVSNESAVIVIDVEEDQNASEKLMLEKDGSIAGLTKARKKPLFKSKNPDATKDVTNALTVKQSVPIAVNTEDSSVKNKKPLFKKRAVSVDEKTDRFALKPSFETQKSVPVALPEKNDTETSSVKDKACEIKTNESNKDSRQRQDKLKDSVAVEKEMEVKNSEQSKLLTVGLDDDDSLQQLSQPVSTEDDKLVESCEEKAQEKSEKPSRASFSFDLFQQQFLSFLSGTVPVKSKSCSQNETDKHKNDIKTRQKKKSESLSIKKKLIEKSNCVSDKTSEVDVNDSKIVKINNDMAIHDGSNEVEVKQMPASDGITAKKKVEKNDIKKSDSFSWLTIFSDKPNNESKSNQNKKESMNDVMTDLSENLAEINKKIVVSDDDDTNSLDMDNVFQTDNLASLEPKLEIKRHNKENKSIKNSANEIGKSCAQKYTRKQTAKRSSGKFKAMKRKVESDLEYSDESSGAETIDLLSSHHGSDLDFNIFNESDDDFVEAKPKHRISRTCSRSRKKRNHECSESDNDSRCSEHEKFETESQTSRKQRMKRGRKSCCPCCLGSPRKRSRDHFSEHQTGFHRESYKLPRDHKQFVRNTVRLLELQEKIHTLFLTLFPECAEIIGRTNLGTEDFELLIDDVLGSLDTGVPFVSACPSMKYDVDKKDHMFVDQHFDSCAINNIGMPFTTPDSASRASEVDFVNSVDGKISNFDQFTDGNNPGNELEQGTLWQHSALLSQSTLAASSSSSSSLKFENNTLADTEEALEDNDNLFSEHQMPMMETSQCVSHNQLLTSATQESFTYLNEPLFVDTNCAEIQHTDSANHLNIPNHYHQVDFDSHETVVQPEITITLDLGALRVSVCRKPKACLQRLQNQISKLSKCLLPKLEFKTYFYRNIDNLEVLVDLMIEANSKDTTSMDCLSESENCSVEDMCEPWQKSFNKFDILETPIIKESDTVQVNFFGVKNDSKLEEREPLFVKCSDLFEREIKSQRESLKKDLFVLEEEKSESTWETAEAVLNSINSLNKMAQRTRRPRDCRLRKRSADEKRTLFVQEKLQNSQNSSFVCHPRATRSGIRSKAGRRRSLPENSKERFLSELNLGDKNVSSNADIVEEPNEPVAGEQHQKCLQPLDGLLQNNMNTVTDAGKVNTEQKVEKVSSLRSSCGQEETDCLLKSGDKNIFELMQPS